MLVINIFQTNPSEHGRYCAECVCPEAEAVYVKYKLLQLYNRITQQRYPWR